MATNGPAVCRSCNRIPQVGEQPACAECRTILHLPTLGRPQGGYQTALRPETLLSHARKAFHKNTPRCGAPTSSGPCTRLGRGLCRHHRTAPASSPAAAPAGVT